MKNVSVWALAGALTGLLILAHVTMRQGNAAAPKEGGVGAPAGTEKGTNPLEKGKETKTKPQPRKLQEKSYMLKAKALNVCQPTEIFIGDENSTLL